MIDITGSAPPLRLTMDSLELMPGVLASSDGRRYGRRLALSLGGGVARAGGESGGLFAVGARRELGVRTRVGVDAALWLADANGLDVQGRVLAAVTRAGLARWLELGAGLGLHFGAGDTTVAPAAALTLRLRVPPRPRAAGYLRYDAALLLGDDTRGQHAITLGLEYGF